ncbi:MAG: hypothetical protein IJ691_06010 [Lachnospiraceae bacterium]|nr:hypothetical protein [Lachnospiraceae bacterium]
MEILYMKEQERDDEQYDFFDVPAVCTPSFIYAFGEEAMWIGHLALMMIRERYPNGNWDYLQSFRFKEIDFWVISDAPRGEPGLDRHITFLLPGDY